MKIETTLNCGDKAWVFNGSHIIQRTVGRVTVQYTQSAGIGDGFIEGDRCYSGGGSEPENYKPMAPELVETYMCVETGIGTGQIYTLGRHIFADEESCRIAHAEELLLVEEQRKAAAEFERESRKQRIRFLRSELAFLEGKE